MKQFKEKSFNAYVTLSDNSYVQSMLERLYNEGELMYDEIHLEGKDIVSDQYYKGLSYGSISSDVLSQKEAIEKEGFHLEYIFTIPEKTQDPFIDRYGSRPDDYCIREETSYALKLKFSFTRLVDVEDAGEEAAAIDSTKAKKTCKRVRLPAPF